MRIRIPNNDFEHLSLPEFVPQPVVVLVVVVEHLAQFVVGYLTLAVVVVLVAVFLVVVVPVVVVQAREHIFVRPGLLILRTYSLLRSKKELGFRI